MYTLGALCFGDAFGDRKDRIASVLDRLLPTGNASSPFRLTASLKYSLKFYPTKRKLIYCSRTVPEIEKALAELKRLIEYRIKHAENEESAAKERNFMGLGLTSRKNLCIHPDVRCLR